ncbi:acyltransferase domain-containing protein [Methylobacterium sp. WL12]|uniref:acyltransferase domain-containing protein n=1 Tax=Methylobacterium sp. WL12 TaxID=2603890 RepID=UPI0011CCCE0B|nr:acyltransferase domain-containing protein [Methylobacterium sp. WL12]TXM72048.1 acyltransferase domain-containing protein [Methylobacterium sp. WL12]
MTLAILCSGQGGQHPGMFDLTAGLPAAQAVFAAAKPLLGADPRDIARAGGAVLNENRTGQILCCVAALAGWTIVAASAPARRIVAGYSIGDLAAWGCAGRFSVETVLALAAARAEAMDAASGVGHGLAGIRGLPQARIADMASAHGCHLAIRNAPDSVVVGGPVDALEAVCRAALAAGAQRAVVLPVRTPSHTPLLAAAALRFGGILRAAPQEKPPRPGSRLVGGLDGTAVFDAAAGLDKLARQIAQTIDWAACLDSCREYGATTVLELGPGHALATMAGSAIPDARVRALEDFRTAAGVTEWLAG